MNYVGLFEGISGFGLAFKRAGANVMAVCEIDKTCQSVLRRHHPEAEIISDVKTISKDTFKGNTIDVLAGGFPCQDLSVAGLRKGLDGERSGLWFEFLRIITDHKPRIVVIENVPGLLSSNGGRDFAIVLRGLVECGYGVCWRVFDSQYDGVAQRRNRVFIIASLGTTSCVEILFERESSQWDSPPSREAGEDITGNAIAGTVSCKWAKGTGGPSGNECQNLTVAPTLRSNGDAHSGFTTGDGLVIEMPEVAGCLDSGSSSGGAGRPGLTVQSASVGHCFPVAFAQNTRDEVRYINGDGQIAGALAAEAGMKQQSYVMAVQTANSNMGGPIHKDECFWTLDSHPSQSHHAIAGQFGVRRLTPTECERLQGFPDLHTASGYDGKPISDSARYRMLGNAVCVPTAEWIARRVAQSLQAEAA